MKFLIFAVLLTSYFTASVEAKEIVIISDLDETLRIANIEKKVKAAGKLITGVKPYEGLRAIFNEMNQKNPDIKFYYLSNSYPFLYCGKQWTAKHGLPKGTVFQRNLKDKSKTFKTRKLREIAQKHPDASFILFGDNVEHDPDFYRNFLKENQSRDISVYIRDAKLVFTEESQMTYFQTEAQITDELEISPETTKFINNLPFNKLVPKFLLKNLKSRIIKSCREQLVSCKEYASQRVQDVVDRIMPNPETSKESSK
jgi:phosphatidate phosphatase APP1